jgi:hypothetical protein
MPWATSKSTGLPEVPMVKSSFDYEFGTHKAHIMISPLPEDKSNLDEEL